ncbi:anthranilate O-methyltransferase 2-like [Aegilops tauschii subsp. strangulata]|uniref:anthranilate O-methyltransferase 2-like n=1 Tax=Aegilops tauschii subsp. strangulata TaxID=200361 RepID=UPI003CC86BB6
MDLHQPAMTAVDLGCSSGQNTLFLVSKVIKVVGRDSDEKSRCNPVELQFFLNDLPGNDFNYVFRSLERFKESIIAEQNTLLPPFYIAGLPGTCYTRLFPRQSCHLFHSSYCLHWLSRGLLEKEKLDSFNLPIYAPSVNEVKEVVAQNGLFNISHIKLFESNWDPHDDSEGGEVQNSEQSGINIAKSLRAVFGPLLAKHFGESLLNRLFKKCANYATQHLERGEGKYLLICVSLKRT